MGEAVFTGVGKKKFFCGIKIDAKQLKISSSFSGWLRFGAKCLSDLLHGSDSEPISMTYLLSTPYSNIEGQKTTCFFKIF